MHRVPLMAGSLLDDGSVFSRANPVQRLFGYRLVMRTIFGPDADRAMELFPAAGDDQVPAAMHRVITVTSFRAPARRLVRWMEAAGGDAWLYHFSRNPGQGRAVRDGVFHGLEIGYVFNTLTAWGDTTDKTLGQDMLRRWVNFARNGDPNGAPAAQRRRIPPGPSTARPRINTWNSAIKSASRPAWTAEHATWPTAPPHAATATAPHASRRQATTSGRPRTRFWPKAIFTPADKPRRVWPSANNTAPSVPRLCHPCYYRQTLQRFTAVRRSPPVYVLCGHFTFRQLFSPKVIWATPKNVPACGKPAGLRQPLAARYATTGLRQVAG